MIIHVVKDPTTADWWYKLDDRGQDRGGAIRLRFIREETGKRMRRGIHPNASQELREELVDASSVYWYEETAVAGDAQQYCHRCSEQRRQHAQDKFQPRPLSDYKKDGKWLVLDDESEA